MNLKDKIVVITGGAKGLGKSLSDLFINRGAIVVVTSHSHVPVSSNKKMIGMQSDVRKESDVKNLAEEVIKKFGAIDI